MENTAIQFACNGCGACCKGRLIPLTLEESRQWLARGHDVAVLLEAFDETQWPTEPARFHHSAGRAAQVRSGSHAINVISVFAANALTQCPNLDAEGRCGIYEERPLVCRIYPSEISPFIALDPADKSCPPEVWEAGEVIFTDRVADPVLARHIEASRRADNADALAKVAICESLGMTTAGWKEHALAVYLPDRQELMAAIERCDAGCLEAVDGGWKVRIENPGLRERVSQRGVQMAASTGAGYVYHEL